MKFLHIKYLHVITIGFKTLLKMVKTDLQYCKLSKYRAVQILRGLFLIDYSLKTQAKQSHIYHQPAFTYLVLKRFIQNIVYVKDFC